jgi:hypothetical protein
MAWLSALFVLLIHLWPINGHAKVARKRTRVVPRVARHTQKITAKPKIILATKRPKLDSTSKERQATSLKDLWSLKAILTSKAIVSLGLLGLFSLLSRELAALGLLLVFLITLALYLARRKKAKQLAAARRVVEAFAREGELCQDEELLNKMRYKTLDKLINLGLPNALLSQNERSLEWEYFERQDAIWRQKKAYVERMLAVFLQKGETCKYQHSLENLYKETLSEVFNLKLPKELALETQDLLDKKYDECTRNITKQQATTHLVARGKEALQQITKMQCPTCCERGQKQEEPLAIQAKHR